MEKQKQESSSEPTLADDVAFGNYQSQQPFLSASVMVKNLSSSVCEEIAAF